MSKKALFAKIRAQSMCSTIKVLNFAALPLFKNYLKNVFKILIPGDRLTLTLGVKNNFFLAKLIIELLTALKDFQRLTSPDVFVSKFVQMSQKRQSSQKIVENTHKSLF